MHRLIFLDPDLIQLMGESSSQHADPDVIDAVSGALKALGREMEEVVRARYFEGLSVPAIAARYEIQDREVVGILYEAKRRLKILLADFPEKRWGVSTDGLCRVCGHPERKKIEKILMVNAGSRSWGAICREVEQAVGERFYPPQVLKAHLKHIAAKDRGNDRG